MVYQHKFLHVFMSLFFFYVLACLLFVSIYLLIAARPLYIQIMTNPYIWMLYAPGPLFVGMSASLLCAVLVRWVYRCKTDGETLIAKDTWGKEVAINPKDIASIHTYLIPFMPLAKIKLESVRWSAWVPKNAVEAVLKQNVDENITQ